MCICVKVRLGGSCTDCFAKSEVRGLAYIVHSNCAKDEFVESEVKRLLWGAPIVFLLKVRLKCTHKTQSVVQVRLAWFC